jgi:Fur family transcriptional regulator, peroxide stress response regulator
MADPGNRLDEMLSRLRERGGRITPQRMAVLRILAESQGHPSVDRIYQQVRESFPTTSLATVYKTVSLLKEMGEVLELGFSDDSNRYDGKTPYPHPHLVCIRCREIMDPELESLSGLQEELIRDTGFRILSHRLDFFGICPKCQQGAEG